MVSGGLGRVSPFLSRNRSFYRFRLRIVPQMRVLVHGALVPRYITVAPLYSQPIRSLEPRTCRNLAELK